MKFEAWHKIAIFLVAVPTAEMYILVHLGNFIGPFGTAALAISTAALGSYLLYLQGGKAWSNLILCLKHEKTPTWEIVDGVFILISGMLLLSPGVVTDIVAITCVIPATRRIYIRILSDAGLLKGLPNYNASKHLLQGKQ